MRNLIILLDDMPPPPPGQPLRQPTSSFSALSFEDMNRVSGDSPVVNTAYVDAVAQSMGFETTDEDYRSSLHSLPLVCTFYFLLAN